MILQKRCKNCLNLFEPSEYGLDVSESIDANKWSKLKHCRSCGTSVQARTQEARTARAERSRKICAVCSIKFSLRDAGLDPADASSRRCWNARTRCGSEECDEIAAKALSEKYAKQRSKATADLTVEHELGSEIKCLLTQSGHIPQDSRDPRHEQYEIMMGKRRRLQ